MTNEVPREAATTASPSDQPVVPIVPQLPAELEKAHREFLAAATSDNTRRTYRSAIRHFLRWGGVLPSDEAAVIRYLLTYASMLNARTLALRLTALSQWHNYQGFVDPTATPTVRKTLKGISRVHGRPKKQARALDIVDLETIVATLAGQSTLKAKRDTALLQLGFFGAFRRSELVGLNASDLSWEREGLLVTLPRSKTDQEGQGVKKAIPFGDGLCCPATAVKEWLAEAHITAGPVFRSINKWGMLGERALQPASVNSILEASAELAGLDHLPEFSSHSLRRGLATSSSRAGADIRAIKRQGGWRRDETVQVYIEDADRFAENAAGQLLRKRPG